MWHVGAMPTEMRHVAAVGRCLVSKATADAKMKLQVQIPARPGANFDWENIVVPWLLFEFHPPHGWGSFGSRTSIVTYRLSKLRVGSARSRIPIWSDIAAPVDYGMRKQASHVTGKIVVRK